jgi:hypothetical protein
MVQPAAVDRWAEKAIRRAIPSVMQEYLCGISRIQALAATDVARKGEVRDFKRTEHVREHLNNGLHRDELKQFIIDALGLAVRPPVDGLAYYESLVHKEVIAYWTAMDDPELRHTDFKNFFGQKEQALRPMTSLRDVDLAGFIAEARIDAHGKRVDDGQTALAMSFIRHGVAGELDQEEDSVATE